MTAPVLVLCKLCGKRKPAAEMCVNARQPNGYMRRCKRCQAADSQRRRDEKAQAKLEAEIAAKRKADRHNFEAGYRWATDGTDPGDAFEAWLADNDNDCDTTTNQEPTDAHP